ncbi:MAG: DUF1217 domain-containing protein [Rhabdaerophilum sp.]
MLTSSNAFPAYPLYKRITPQFMTANTIKVSKSAEVQAEVAYFKAKVSKLQNVDDFFKDSRLLRFALTAYNMEDQLQYPGRIKQIMKGDASNPRSLVRQMTSPGYREINAAFDFFNSGVTKLKSDGFQTEVIARFYSTRGEKTLSDLNPDLADALYFERMIGKAKNGYEVIGDPILFDVVKKAFNLPPMVSGAKIEKLKALVESKLDFTRLNNQPYIKGIAERFLVLKDVETRQNQGGGLIDMFA